MKSAQRTSPPLEKGGQGGFQRRWGIGLPINPPHPPFFKGGRRPPIPHPPFSKGGSKTVEAQR